MSLRETLLIVARRYAEIENIPLSTVSSRALNDGKKLAALEGGADITVGRLEEALSWFSENWPAGDWPDGVARPVTASEEARA